MPVSGMLYIRATVSGCRGGGVGTGNGAGGFGGSR